MTILIRQMYNLCKSFLILFKKFILKILTMEYIKFTIYSNIMYA